MDLYLVRHGQTDWSQTGRHTSTTDISLNKSGEAESMALRPIVSRLLAGSEPGLVLASPRKRALETLNVLRPNAAFETENLLEEYRYGELEGLTPDEIIKDHPGWDIWRDGCPGGESTEEVGRRADGVLERCDSSRGPVILVSHGHMLRILAARALGLPAASGSLFRLSTASVSVLQDYRGRRMVALWNLGGGL